MSCKMIRSNGGSCGRRFASPEDLPYIVWDSTGNDEYGPAPSLHSHPASIITYNHIPPMINSCQASSTLSWDSSSFPRRCCSPACCAILLTAILILAALLTVIGVAVYLGIITNLSKATILPVSGRFRVISGDDFVPSLYNTSSTAFLEKAEKYNAIIHSALQWTSIDNSIIKSEVYAFRKGSLIVHFRVYLDQKKIIQARNALAYSRKSIESKSTQEPEEKSSASSRNDQLIPSLVQHELKEGLIQLRMIGPGRPEIDFDSLIVTSYHTDPMLNLKDQSMPLQIRGNIFYEKNSEDTPIDSVLTAIHLKPLKSTRRPTLTPTRGPIVGTSSTSLAISTTTSTTSTTTTTTTTPLPSSKPNKYQSKPSAFDSNNNILTDERKTFLYPTNDNRRHSNYHSSNSPSLINRFAERLRPSKPSLTTVRPVTASTTPTTTTTGLPIITSGLVRVVLPRAPTTATTTTTRPPFVSTTRRVRMTPSTTSTSTSTSTTTTTTTKTTTASTSTTTTPEPPAVSTEVTKLTSRDPSSFTRKTTRTRIDFPMLLAGLRSTVAPSTTVSVGTVSPIPPHHKPPPGTSIKVTSLDFGQWRPLSPFKSSNQPKSQAIKLMPSLSSPSSSNFASQSPSISQFAHLKPPQILSPSSLDFSSPIKNRFSNKPEQNKMPLVIAVSPGEHIRRRIPISAL